MIVQYPTIFNPHQYYIPSTSISILFLLFYSYGNHNLHQQQERRFKLLSGSNVPQIKCSVYSDAIDVRQIIQNQMERENISHIHFWFARENLNTDNGKESNLLINFGKYLIENKDGNFKFQYIVERYSEQKKENKQDYQKSFNTIDYIQSTSERVKRDEESTKLQKSFLHRDQLIRQQIKFGTFRDFQAFIRKEMNSNLDSDIIKKYLFRTREQSIAVSFFQSSQLKTIQRIIQEDSDQIYNAKLHFRKISTIHPEDFQKNKRKTQNYQQPNQLYHRLILFLFTPQKNEDLRDPKRKRTFNTSMRYGATNKIQANQSLSNWRIKQQVDALLKYQKQCDLIKQEIENEKLIFRNKIKLIQNYIGDSINIQKLFQEEEELVIGTSIATQANNTFTTSTSKKTNSIGKRSSLTTANSQMLGSLQKMSRFNQASTNNSSFLIVTEFKRLKQISETIRNIDNTIVQQNRKKQQLQKRVKQLAKERQELLFRNAKELNEIRKGTIDIKKDIERKENQIKQKYQSGQFKVFLSYKTRQPSELAKQSLKNHIHFLNQYQQKSQKINGTTFNEFDQIQNVREIQQRLTNRNMHISEFKDVTNINAMKLMHKRSKQALKTKQIIDEQISNKFGSDGYKNISKSSHVFSKKSDGPNNKILQKQLRNLYQYYISNRGILEQASKQLLAYHRVSHKPNQNKETSNMINQFKLQINLSELPLLEQIISYKQKRQSGFTISSQNQQMIPPRPSSIYGQDYFSLMINSNNKSKPKNAILQKNNINSLKQTFSESFSDQSNKMKATSIELLQKNIGNLTAKPSKFKRITIQQAINKHQMLKKVRINSKDYD